MTTEKKKKTPLVSVWSGLFVAVVGALGDILTLLAIPVGPNIHINLYVLPAVLVGSTLGWLLGGIGGFIGALYTIILWGWVGAIVYATLLGVLSGLLATKAGFRPIIAGTLAAILALPWMLWSQAKWLGFTWPVNVLAIGTTTFQMLVASILTELIMAIPGMKKRFPTENIHAWRWVAKSKLLRHPWLELE